MFCLVDCNNFFASCERVFRPDLEGKPIVVLSNNDGCVIARSNEVKALGVPMGAPAFKYQRLFDFHKVAVFSTNFPLYGDMSSRVMSILAQHCPQLEIYSIDEAFLDLRGVVDVDYQAIGRRICKQVLQWTGLPVSVGFAKTKTLAKLANHIAKKYPEQTKGCYVIDDDKKRIKALKWQEIGDVWGIGRKYMKRLKLQGIHHAYDLTQQSDTWVHNNMSIVGLRLKHELEGIPQLEMEVEQGKKSITCTRTFETNYTEYGDIQERVASFAANCAEKLRKQDSGCYSVMVFVRTNYFDTQHEQYAQNIMIQSAFPTNSTIEIVRMAKQGLKQIFKSGYRYKRAGVLVMNLVEMTGHQLDLFEQSDPKHRSLMKAIDTINHQYGSQKIRLGSQDTGRIWKMKQEHLSPHYTTRLEDIMPVNCKKKV